MQHHNFCACVHNAALVDWMLRVFTVPLNVSLSTRGNGDRSHLSTWKRGKRRKENGDLELLLLHKTSGYHRSIYKIYRPAGDIQETEIPFNVT